MMVTVFLWTNNINVPCKPPPPMFLRVKFGKKSGGNTRVNTVPYTKEFSYRDGFKMLKFIFQCKNIMLPDFL
jgi:hypothetical protein